VVEGDDRDDHADDPDINVFIRDSDSECAKEQGRLGHEAQGDAVEVEAEKEDGAGGGLHGGWCFDWDNLQKLDGRVWSWHRVQGVVREMRSRTIRVPDRKSGTTSASLSLSGRCAPGQFVCRTASPAQPQIPPSTEIG